MYACKLYFTKIVASDIQIW
jgi:hypothetical protein